MRLLTLVALLLSANGVASEIPLPDEKDRVRLAEVFHLADAVQDDIWKGWSAVPFVILLVTPDYEYLVRHPYPSEDFTSLGHDETLNEEIFARNNSGNYSTGFLATFPAIRGVNTVVIGQPENTGKDSTQWVVTALHEHFHQLQYTRPWYQESVEALDLSGGDTSGMWQLNYPFPYESKDVGKLINDHRLVLLEATNELREGGIPRAGVCRESMRSIGEGLDAADLRYFSFQLWQEGVARYTEHAVARAASTHYQPMPAFTRLEDFVPYSEASKQLDEQLQSELENLNPAGWERVIFYPLGAAEALLADATQTDWKKRYFLNPFENACSRG